MDPTQMVLLFLITKPIFLLIVIWIVIWRHRHAMNAEMLPYRSSSPPELTDQGPDRHGPRRLTDAAPELDL